MSATGSAPGAPRLPAAALGTVVALLAALLAGCSATVPGIPSAASGTVVSAERSRPEPPPQSGNVYVDPQGRFSLVLPAGWQVDPAYVGPDVAFVDSRVLRDADAYLRGARISVTVSTWSGGLTETTDIGRQARLLESYAPGVDQAVELPDGSAALLIGGVFVDHLSTDVDLEVHTLYAVRDGRRFVVSASADTEVWDSYGGSPVFDAALVSLLPSD